MLVSVIIPAFNEEKYIEQTLKRLESQTFKDFEIVVVDNNSTDKTAEIAKSYGAKVIHEPLQGAVFAYNAGMWQSTGDIIVNIDADTIPPDNWLETIVKELEPENVVAVTGTAGVETGSKIGNALSRYSYTLFVGFNFLIGKPHISGFNFGVKRSAFIKVNGMDTAYRMSFEVDLGLRLAKVGKVVFANNLCVITSSRRWKKDQLQALIEYAKGYIYTIWLRKPPPFKQTVIR